MGGGPDDANSGPATPPWGGPDGAPPPPPEFTPGRMPPPPTAPPLQAINRQLFCTWVSLAYITMAQLGVPHPAAQRRAGWAWAG